MSNHLVGEMKHICENLDTDKIRGFVKDMLKANKTLKDSVALTDNLAKSIQDKMDTFGVSFEESITQEELDLINEKRKKDGLELRTMDDFK